MAIILNLIILCLWIFLYIGKFTCIEIAVAFIKISFLRKITQHPKPLSRSQITRRFESRKNGASYSYIYSARPTRVLDYANRMRNECRGSHQIKRYSKGGACDPLHVRPWQTLEVNDMTRSWLKRYPCQRILPRDNIVYRIINRWEKESAAAWIIRLSVRRGMHLEDGLKTHVCVSFVYLLQHL